MAGEACLVLALQGTDACPQTLNLRAAAERGKDFVPKKTIGRGCLTLGVLVGFIRCPGDAVQVRV